MANLERVLPREGWTGMEFSWVLTVRVVLKPEMYWESNSRPTCWAVSPPNFAGFQDARIIIPVLFPRTTVTLVAVASASTESLLSTWIFI